jgi:hypothetical protein
MVRNKTMHDATAQVIHQFRTDSAVAEWLIQKSATGSERTAKELTVADNAYGDALVKRFGI